MYSETSVIKHRSLTISNGSDLHEIEAVYTGTPRPRIFDMDVRVPMWENIEFQAYPLLLAKPRINEWNNNVYCMPVGFAVDEILTPAMMIQNSPEVTLGPSKSGEGYSIFTRYRRFKLVNIQFTVYPNSNCEFSGDWAMQLIPFMTAQDAQKLSLNTQILFPGDYVSEPNSLISCQPVPGRLSWSPDESSFCGRFVHPEAEVVRVRFSYQMVREFRENAGLYNDLLPRSAYNFRFMIKTKWLASGWANYVVERNIGTLQYGPGKQAAIKSFNWANSAERYHAWSKKDKGPFALWFVWQPEFFHCLFNGYVMKTNKTLNPVYKLETIPESIDTSDTPLELECHEGETEERTDDDFVLLG